MEKFKIIIDLISSLSNTAIIYPKCFLRPAHPTPIFPDDVYEYSKLMMSLKFQIDDVMKIVISRYVPPLLPSSTSTTVPLAPP